MSANQARCVARAHRWDRLPRSRQQYVQAIRALDRVSSSIVHPGAAHPLDDRSNIPVSSRTTTLATDSAALAYQPPHPSPQTPYHRYTLLLLRQPSSTPMTPSVPEDRASFILRDWIAENGYGKPEGVVKGIHMFREGGKGFGKDFRDIAEEHKREVEAVGKIYSEVLGTCSDGVVDARLMLSSYDRRQDANVRQGAKGIAIRQAVQALIACDVDHLHYTIYDESTLSRR